MNARVLICLAAMGAATPAMADPSGNKWTLPACGTGCAGGHTCLNNRCVITYRIAATIDNSGGTTLTGGVLYSGVIPRIQSDFQAWITGRVSCGTSWMSTYGGTFNSPSGRNAINSGDLTNNVIFLSGASWTHLANELAITTTAFLTTTHEIIDADMELNNNVNWSTNVAGTLNAYDVDTVVVHEAGHFLGLNHSSPSQAVMNAFVSPNSSKRVLTMGDEADVCSVYPPGAGSVGSTCSSISDCANGLVCEAQANVATPIKVCAINCAGTNDTCSTGYECIASTDGFACLPRLTPVDACKACQSAGECSTGLCLRFGDGVTFCSRSCTATSDCGAGYYCQLSTPGQAADFCVPNANKCTNQCTNASQCPSTYTCTNGACRPRGDPGDTCTVSGFCKDCGVCTLESATSGSPAFCRSCCGTASGTDSCAGCTNTSCGTDQTCTALNGETGKICLPGSTTPGTCQTCGADGSCADGLACVLGRCRLACNSASTGTCQACFADATSGTTACACADEVVGIGEFCGRTGNTLAACAMGLACSASGTSNVCRAICDLSVTGSCPTGFACQQQGTLGLCLPGTQGSSCAPCTSTNSCNPGLSCYLGRCYEPCNLSSPGTCSTCVQTQSGGVGVCSCSDEISAENDPCGATPSLRGCTTGTACVNGYCRAKCDPSNYACVPGTDCKDVGGGQFYCTEYTTPVGGGGGTPVGGGRGGGTARGGGGGASGGGGGGSSMDLGCGCGSTGSAWGAMVFGVLLIRRRRRS